MTVEEAKAIGRQMRELYDRIPYGEYGPDGERLVHVALAEMDVCNHCGGDGHYSDGMACQCWNDD